MLDETMIYATMKEYWVHVDQFMAKQPHYLHMCYRASVEVKNPNRGIIYITAGTLYKLYINGSLVMYGPCRSLNDIRYVDTIDIAPRLQDGKNVIAVEVVYLPIGPDRKVSPHCLHEPGFGLYGEIDGDSGSKVITSGVDFKYRCFLAHDQKARFERHDLEEKVDMNKLDHNWMAPEYVDDTWSAVQAEDVGKKSFELSPRPINLPTLRTIQPVRAMESGQLIPDEANAEQDRVKFFRSAKMIGGGGLVRQPGGVLIPGKTADCYGTDQAVSYIALDFGTTVSGFYEITAVIPQGVMLDVNLLEWLDNQTGAPRYSNRFGGAVRGTPGYTVEGNGSKVTFGGFHLNNCRYACIVPRNLQEGEVVKIHSFTACEVSSQPLVAQAEVTCSDPVLNRIIDAAMNTVRVLAPDLFVDTAQELVVTGGDSIRSLEASRLFFGKSGNSVSETTLGMFAESVGRIEHWPHMPVGRIGTWKRKDFLWNMAACTYILEILGHYRDIGAKVPEKYISLIAGMRMDVEQYLNTEGLLEDLPDCREICAYWTDWSRMMINKGEHPEIHVSVNALYYKAFMEMFQYTGDPKYEEICTRIGAGLRKLAYPYLESKGSRTKRFVPDVFIRKNGELIPLQMKEATLWGNENAPHRSETTQNWLLWSGALEPYCANLLWQVLREWRANEIHRLDDNRVYNVARSNVTVGLWPRFEYEWQRRDAEALYRDARDVFGYMIDRGDYLWEVMSQDARSSTHAAPTFIGPIVYRALTGIYPGEQGYKTPLIAPLVDGTIQWARGSFQMETGAIGVSWEQDADTFSMTIHVPEGVRATVVIPPYALMKALRGGHRLPEDGKITVDKGVKISVSLTEGVKVQ
jgi:hypothetical protein